MPYLGIFGTVFENNIVIFEINIFELVYRARGYIIKYTMRIYDDKVYTNFLSLNVPEDDKECESFTIIPIDSFLVYENKYEM